MLTQAQKRAMKKYDAKFAKLTVRLKPELKRSLKDYCERNNVSETEVVIRAITKFIEN